MPRKPMLIGVLTLLAAGLLPALAPASAAPLPGLATSTQPRDEGRYVNLANGEEPRAIPPDIKTTANGRRVEIYSSVGDNQGGMDWRTVDEFAYLVNSVPKGSESYTTLFNSLYDGRSVSRVADPANPGQYTWTVANPSEAFAPTAAYLNQVNLYSATGNSTDFIHVLGAKESIDEAYAANSSLAKLVQSGYHGRPGTPAVDYEQCAGAGGCLSGPTHLMHSKYGAFQKAKDSDGVLHDNVVWITSSNLNGSSGSKKANVSMVIYDDAKAYNSIVNGIFKPSVQVANGTSPTTAMSNPLYKDAIAVDPATGVITGMPTDSGIQLFPSPRALTGAADKLAKTDVEAAFLNGKAADNANKSGCKVYAVHSLFNSTRNGVKDGLGKLLVQKCDVRVVLGENAISDIIDGYFSMSTNLRELVGRVEFANVHDKTLSYKDNTTATTFGGASNFTGPGLEYDELAFRADNPDVTDAVQEHSEQIYELAKGQVTWATPTSVSVSPTGTLNVKVGDKLALSPRVAPNNALVAKTTWTSLASTNGGVATVSPDGVVTGIAPGIVPIQVTVSSPEVVNESTIRRSKTVNVYVTAGGTTTAGSGGRANVPPTLTMDNYQSPSGSTDIVVTWGSGGDDYDGIVKLQYYASGWKTYTKQITVTNGIGRISSSFASSKTWRAYGARLDRINGKDVPNSTAKTMSKWSINTVRTQSPTYTPRLYATSLAKSGQMVPFLISWNVGGGVFRLQMRSSGGLWKTHSTYRIPSGGDQEFIAVPVLNTKYWRIATSTGSTKISNTVKVVMK